MHVRKRAELAGIAQSPSGVDSDMTVGLRRAMEKLRRTTRGRKIKTEGIVASRGIAGALKVVVASLLRDVMDMSKYVNCKVMGLRDARNAGRFVHAGTLAFSMETQEDCHKKKTSEQAAKQGSRCNYDSVIRNTLSISEGCTTK